MTPLINLFGFLAAFILGALVGVYSVLKQILPGLRVYRRGMEDAGAKFFEDQFNKLRFNFERSTGYDRKILESEGGETRNVLVTHFENGVAYILFAPTKRKDLVHSVEAPNGIKLDFDKSGKLRCIFLPTMKMLP